MIQKEPQPLSITDNGGKIMANKTLKKLIYNLVGYINKTFQLLFCYINYILNELYNFLGFQCHKLQKRKHKLYHLHQ